MKISSKLIGALLLLPALAFAQADVTQYNRGLSAYNSSNFEEAGQVFYDLAENSTDPEIRPKAEYYLAQTLAKKGLPVAATLQYTLILRAGKSHPYYLKAVEGLVGLQAAMDDQYLIPQLINNEYAEEWATLSQENLARINYLIGVVSQRKSKFDDARNFLEAVPPESRIYAKARYLTGIVLVDPRYPKTEKEDPVALGIQAFEDVTKLKDPNQEDLLQMQHLATLALGRTYYGIGQYGNSSAAYEKIPRFSKYWDQALFENGFARFQDDDFGGALGSLQALHAPQFTGAFQPESWVLKGTVYYFSCLYEEAKTALKEFDAIYLPMDEKLKPLVEGEPRDFDFYYNLVADEQSDRLPRAVKLWVRSNDRMISVFNILKQIEQEKATINGTEAWRGGKLTSDLVGRLDQQRGGLVQVAGQLAKNRLVEAHRMIKTHSDNAEIIRFETTKAERQLYEAGVDQQKLLAQKTLYRPAMPAEDWNYWKFQGEFWIDEIGYYQYTLKRGCPESAGE